MALRPVPSVRFAPYANLRFGAVVPERGFYVIPSGSDADLYWSDGKQTTYSVQRSGSGGQTPISDDAVLSKLNVDSKISEEQGQLALTAKTEGKSVLAALGVPARTAPAPAPSPAPAPAPAPTTPTVAPTSAPATVEEPQRSRRRTEREEAPATVVPPAAEPWLNKRTIGVSAAILAGLVVGGLLVRSVTDVSDEAMIRSRSRLG
jgi:hypothetical protein